MQAVEKIEDERDRNERGQQLKKHTPVKQSSVSVRVAALIQRTKTPQNC